MRKRRENGRIRKSGARGERWEGPTGKTKETSAGKTGKFVCDMKSLWFTVFSLLKEEKVNAQKSITKIFAIISYNDSKIGQF